VNPARPVLERLLRRAESARLRGAAEPASLPMSGAAEYAALCSLGELEAFHAAIALAERAGAIRVQRDGRSGDGSRLLRLTVADPAALASHLDLPLLGDQVDAAERELDSWIERFPVIAEVLEAWRRGRKVRGGGPEAAVDLAAAAVAVAARAADAGHERILRRESVRLFGDSKRLERLTPWLEVLASGELAATALSPEEVWSAIGLRREPQPMLLAGIGAVVLGGAPVPAVRLIHAGVRCLHVPDEPAVATLPLVRPYMGLPVERVQAVTTAATCVLTIENLATFHETALAATGAPVLLIYTGGMPSPAWRAAYVRILRGLGAPLPVYHWGDIDEGGFRIAAVLAGDAREAGFTLGPWLMSPSELAPDIPGASAPAPAVLARMCRWAERAGWSEVSEALRHHPLQLEQESLDPRLPAGSVGS
jgi:hypothetical protein